MNQKKKSQNLDSSFREPDSSKSLNFKQKSKKNKKVFFNKSFLDIIISAFILTAVGSLIGIIALFSFFKNIEKDLTSITELQNIKPNIITRIYSVDDSLIKEFFTEKRIQRPLEEITPNLYNALIASEDKDFFNHWGMNIYSMIGAIKQSVFNKKRVRGASTITQQLARNLYASIGYDRTIMRKIKELFTAIQIEKTYTKKEILELYLNQVYLGGGNYGFQAAAQFYFGYSTLEAMPLTYCAALIGMLPAPETYRPDKHMARTIKRRNVVLKEMYKDKKISKKELKKALKDTLLVPEKVENIGTSLYFVEMVRQFLEKNYGAGELYGSGMNVHTTLNFEYQKAAEKASLKHLDTLQRAMDSLFIVNLRLQRFKGFKKPLDTLIANLDNLLPKIDSMFFMNKLDPKDSLKIIKKAVDDSLKLRIIQTSLVAIDNKSGGIISLIGGRDFKESKFNRAVQAWRQPGSAFKPFVFAAAIDNGYTPASILLDQAFSVTTPDGEWRPNNYSQKFSGPITLRRALDKSKNTIAIKLQQSIGTNTIIEYAENLGIQKRGLRNVFSLAIGACEVTPLDITSAFSVFPNYGKKIEPYFIEEILDRDGKLLYSNNLKESIALSEKTAYMMCSLLKSVVFHGTGYRAVKNGLTRDAGGKTGTTNDYSDAWFVGFTPQITCGVWTGIDARRSMGRGKTGSSAALPIWSDYMLFVHDTLGMRVEKFQKPRGIATASICHISHKIAKENCDSTYQEVFIVGTEPELCDLDHLVTKEKEINELSPFDLKQHKLKKNYKGKKRRPYML